MSNQSEDWGSIFERYKSSGLSQRAFCTQHDVSWNQFHYRWSLYKSGLKSKTRFMSPESKATPLFEQVTIATPNPKKQTVGTHGVVIHFPNRIRCEVSLALEGNEFPLLLKHLVTLC